MFFFFLLENHDLIFPYADVLSETQHRAREVLNERRFAFFEWGGPLEPDKWRNKDKVRKETFFPREQFCAKYLSQNFWEVLEKKKTSDGHFVFHQNFFGKNQQKKENKGVFFPKQHKAVFGFCFVEMRTLCVCLVMCLNIGVDPPDTFTSEDGARIESWIGNLVFHSYGLPFFFLLLDPSQMPRSRATENIGVNLEKQYKRWQGRVTFFFLSVKK